MFCVWTGIGPLCYKVSSLILGPASFEQVVDEFNNVTALYSGDSHSWSALFNF